MKCCLIFLLILSVYTVTVVSNLNQQLNGNTFFIINSGYENAKLVQPWNIDSVSTTYNNFKHDQLWTFLESANHPGYFFIRSFKFPSYYVNKWGEQSDYTGTSLRKGNPESWLLWKIVKYDKTIHADNKDDLYKYRSKEYESDKEEYLIYNMKWSKAKLSKIQHNDRFYSQSYPNFHNRFNRNVDRWIIKPRFEATVAQASVWRNDNRAGSKSFTEKVKFIEGLIVTNSETVTNTASFTKSLSLSAAAAFGGGSAESSVTKTLTTTIMTSTQKTWSKTVETFFEAPAGKLYEVFQTVVSFVSPISSDNCQLRTHYKIEESS